ncbi:MAG: hypothetical protein LBE65_01930 [Synergistaceae bacterium]|jgi:hypothetical protein|nr:hypothetical protein [Synergistaceae bacterium]
MDTGLAYYKPSGVAPPSGVILTTLAGCVLAVAAGALYGIISYTIPLIFLHCLNFVFAGELGFLLGFAVSKGVSAFHVRNVSCAVICGIIVFACAYVSHWFFYLAAYGITKLSGAPEIFGTAYLLFENPREAWKRIQFINGDGWPLTNFSDSGEIMIRGWTLWTIWTAEAIWIGYLTLAAPVRQANAPYSERRGIWMDAVDLPKHIAFIENVSDFKKSFSGGDYGALMTPFDVWRAPLDPRDEKYAVVTMYPDSWDPYISVSNVTVKHGKKKRRVSAENVVKYLKLPAEISLEIKDALS